jgi:hypothetical protein
MINGFGGKITHEAFSSGWGKASTGSNQARTSYAITYHDDHFWKGGLLQFCTIM